MLLRPITFEEAAAHSPWPDRISGKASWRKERRDHTDIELEYNAAYDALQNEWQAYSLRLPQARRDAAACLRFYSGVRGSRYQDLAKRPDIFGSVDLKNYLVSVEDRLYLADILLFDTMMRHLVVETVHETRSIEQFDGILEAGCGYGINLLNLFCYQGLEIAGVDLSPKAIAFLQGMAKDLGLDARFEVSDFLNADLASTAPTQKWSLLSFHAVEQAERVTLEWFERLAGSANPPVFGLHFEPLQIPDGSEFSHQCRRYAEINLYNTDFYSIAQQAAELGLIKIVQQRKRVLGSSAFNPTSVLIWKPVR